MELFRCEPSREYFTLCFFLFDWKWETDADTLRPVLLKASAFLSFCLTFYEYLSFADFFFYSFRYVRISSIKENSSFRVFFHVVFLSLVFRLLRYNSRFNSGSEKSCWETVGGQAFV